MIHKATKTCSNTELKSRISTREKVHRGTDFKCKGKPRKTS